MDKLLINLLLLAICFLGIGEALHLAQSLTNQFGLIMATALSIVSAVVASSIMARPYVRATKKK